MVQVDVASLAPFRGGQGGMRMGLRPVAPDAWLESGPLRDQRIAAKQALLAQGVRFAATLPGSAAAQAELGRLLGTAGDITSAALATAEDLCLLERAGASHVLTAGAVAFPTDWHLDDKLGLPLAAIHQPIPGYLDKLSEGVERFFDQLAPGPVYARANWFIVETDALRYLPEGPAAARFAGITPDTAAERLFVRCERQTLRRLPETGAVLFTIGVHLAPLGRLGLDLARDLWAAARSQHPAEFVRKDTPLLLPLLEAHVRALERGLRPGG